MNFIKTSQKNFNFWFKFYRFLMFDEPFVSMSMNAKVLYCLIDRYMNQFSDEENIYAALSNLTNIDIAEIDEAFKELKSNKLIDKDKETNTFLFIEHNTKSKGYVPVPDFLKHSFFNELSYAEKVLYAVILSRHQYILSQSPDHFKEAEVYFPYEQLTSMFNCSIKNIIFMTNKLVKKRLLKASINEYNISCEAFIPENIDNDVAVYEELKKEQLISGFPINSALALKETDFALCKFIVERLKRAEKKAEMFDLNQFFACKYNINFFKNIIYEIKFLEREKFEKLTEFEKLISRYFDIRLVDYYVAGGADEKRVKDANGVTQVEYRALKKFAEVEDEVIASNSEKLIETILSKLNKSDKHLNNQQLKEKVIDEFGIAFRSFFPKSVKDYLLNLDRKSLFYVLDTLAYGLELAYKLVHRNLRSHVIDFCLIETRLLRAVQIANIYNQNRKRYKPYDVSIGMIIGDEIEASFKENHSKKSLEVNEEIVEDILSENALD